MPPPIPVTIAPYDPKWLALAEAYSKRLQSMGSVLVAVHHVGSTSVPGLAAKPVIDLLPVVTSLSALDDRRILVEEAGYLWHGEMGLTDRRYCTLSDEHGDRLAQLHFFRAGCGERLRRQPQLRDSHHPTHRPSPKPIRA